MKYTQKNSYHDTNHFSQPPLPQPIFLYPVGGHSLFHWWNIRYSRRIYFHNSICSRCLTGNAIVANTLPQPPSNAISNTQFGLKSVYDKHHFGRVFYLYLYRYHTHNIVARCQLKATVSLIPPSTPHTSTDLG